MARLVEQTVKLEGLQEKVEKLAKFFREWEKVARIKRQPLISSKYDVAFEQGYIHIKAVALLLEMLASGKHTVGECMVAYDGVLVYKDSEWNDLDEQVESPECSGGRHTPPESPGPSE